MNSTVFRPLRAIVSGAVLTSLPILALADGLAGGKWFVEAKFDDVQAKSTVAGFTIDGDESGWSLGVGYAFNRYFALQAAYHELGDNHFATDCPPPNVCVIENLDRADIDGVSLAALGTYPINRYVDVYAKLGVLSWDTNLRRSGFGETGEDLLYGVGVGVTLLPNWRLSLQYEESDFDTESAGLALRYQF